MSHTTVAGPISALRFPVQLEGPLVSLLANDEAHFLNVTLRRWLTFTHLYVEEKCPLIFRSALCQTDTALQTRIRVIAF